MRKFWLFACILSLSLALAACDDEEESGDAAASAQASISSSAAEFTATEEGGTILFGPEGGEVVVNVDCSVDWLVDNYDSDLFGAVADVKNGTLTVSAEQNTVEQELEGTIVLSFSASRAEFATISITQDAYGASRLGLETNEWHAPAVGALSVTLSVSATQEWFVEDVDADWLSAVKEGDNALVLTVLENDTTESRKGEAVLVCTDGISSFSEAVSVMQDGLAYVNLDSETLSVKGYVKEYYVGVESNFEWDFSNGNDWLSLSAEEGVLIVTVSQNSTGDIREGTVLITAGDGAENYAEAVLSVVQQVATDPLVLTYTISSGGTEVHLPLSGTVDCEVDWGDGSGVEIVSSAQPSHTYEEAGEYDISIDGVVTALSSNSISSSSAPLPLTAVKQWGDTGLEDMSYAFYYCTGLQSLPEENPSALLANVKSFERAFYCDRALDSIPADTFAGCSAAETFSYAFYNCSSLTELPEGLFKDCTAVKDMSYAFYYCQALESLPEGLFSGLSEVTTFQYVFATCLALQTLPESLFAGCSAAENFYYAFFSCETLETVPGGLFGDCTAAKDFGYAFYDCCLIEEIPAGLFDGSVNVTSFLNTFYGCSSLTVIPTGLFDNCVSVEDFTATFHGCSSLTAIPTGLFDNCTVATSFREVFGGCSSLTTLPDGLFDKNVAAESFWGTFQDCTSLTSIPDGLFDNCPEVTTFYRVFYNCSSLAAIPKGLFSSSSKAENISWVFCGCSGITSIPEGLFDNCTSATDMSLCFQETSITSIPEGLFAKCSQVTKLEQAFMGCRLLESIPEKLFANNTLNTDFSNVFRYCESLLEIPEGLFANCPEVTDFSYAFSECTGLTSLPKGLFDGNTKVTKFTQTFADCVNLTGESPYTIIDEEKIHLYERTTALGFSKPSNYQKCFNNCTALEDHEAIYSAKWCSCEPEE